MPPSLNSFIHLLMITYLHRPSKHKYMLNKAMSREPWPMMIIYNFKLLSVNQLETITFHTTNMNDKPTEIATFKLNILFDRTKSFPIVALYCTVHWPAHICRREKLKN